MASGQTLFTLTEFMAAPPTTDAASMVLRVGGSTPPESWYVWSFPDGATTTYIDFVYRMPQNYAGTTGISCRINWTGTTATTGNVIWNIALRRLTAEDIDGSHSYSPNAVTDAAPSTAGIFEDAVITFTDGTDMDSVVAGDTFILRLSRDSNNGSDTMTDAAQVKLIEVRET